MNVVFSAVFHYCLRRLLQVIGKMLIFDSNHVTACVISGNIQSSFCEFVIRNNLTPLQKARWLGCRLLIEILKICLLKTLQWKNSKIKTKFYFSQNDQFAVTTYTFKPNTVDKKQRYIHLKIVKKKKKSHYIRLFGTVSLSRFLGNVSTGVIS